MKLDWYLLIKEKDKPSLKAFSKLAENQIKLIRGIEVPMCLLIDDRIEIDIKPLDNERLEFKDLKSGDSIIINRKNFSISLD